VVHRHAGMHIPLIPDRPRAPHPKAGPLRGRRVIVVAAPTELDGRQLRVVRRRLEELGAWVEIAIETQGEARDEQRHAIKVHRLLIEVDPVAWDALVFVGGAGAERVAEDELARTLARRFAAAGKPVAAVGEGRAVLGRAGVAGLGESDPESLAHDLAVRLTC
jgi:putative intracellular protease/amidase